MKFESFEENCKNIKAIKFKKWEDITNQQHYNPFFISWGKSLEVVLLKKEFGLLYFSDKETHRYTFYLDEEKFEDTVEYIETNGLEIE